MFAKKTKTDAKYGCYRNVFAIWFPSSSFRKASKCKLHIKNLLCSIKVHRKRRECMVRQSKSDIAQLLHNDHLSEILPKAKQIYEDERRLLAYEHVEYFCISMLQNFPNLKRQSDVNVLPEETKEAMAGLIFAASRIGELRELQYIRSLFVRIFGIQFDKDSVDLRQGHFVSSEIIKSLDKETPEDAISKEIVMEISQSYKTNITTYVDSSEDSASDDTVETEQVKTVGKRKNLKVVYSNLGETQGKDRSLFMR